jgi:hypothetical protein
MSALQVVKTKLGHFYDRNFVIPPHRGLRALYRLRLELVFFILPVFVYYNRRALKKLFSMRLRGLEPAIILYLNESDGRFIRAAELSRTREDMVFFILHKHLLGVESFIFGKGPKRQVGFYDDARMIYNEPVNQPLRAEYKKYCIKFITALKVILGRWDILLTGSNNDRNIVEMISALQECGGSVVVCEREGTGTDYSYIGEGECFKASKSIQAHYIFTANERHREMFYRARLPSVRDVRVLGEIDTDFWLHWKRNFTRPQYRDWDRFRKKLVFLTFGIRNYIEPYLFPQFPDISWQQLLNDTEDEVFKLASENPDILVFYKMGHLEDNNKKFIQRCKDKGLNNVESLDRTFPCEELMLYSDGIIGFQSTAMFEAMFTDKPLLFLKWAIPDCIDRDTQMLPIDKYGAVEVAESKDQLRSWLSGWASGSHGSGLISDEIKKARKITRELMFYDADGRGGEKLLAELQRILSDRQVHNRQSADRGSVS